MPKISYRQSDSAGLVKINTFSNPGAGANLAYTHPNVVGSRTMWEIICLRFVLTTDATVATRTVILSHGSGGVTVANRISSVTQLLGLGYTYFFDPNWPLVSGLTGGFNIVHSNLFKTCIMPGDTLVTAITNLQAADVLNQITALVREWIID